MLCGKMARQIENVGGGEFILHLGWSAKSPLIRGHLKNNAH